MVLFLILCYCILNFNNKFFNKKLQTIFPDGNAVYAFYAFITGAISVINFLILTDFHPIADTITLVFAFIYAMLCRLGYFITFKSLQYHGVFLNDAFGRVGRIIPPMIISALFLGQPQGLGTVVGGICVIIAAILPGKFSKDDLKGTGKKRALYAIAFILLCTSSTMCVKMYVDLQSPEDLISFCLFTNIFIAITSVISLIAEIPRGNVRKEIQLLGKWHYLFIIILAVGSNVTAYVDSFMLEYVDVIKNTIITSSIGIVVTLLVTGINKEKITIRHIISACLSLVSVIFPLFF